MPAPDRRAARAAEMPAPVPVTLLLPGSALGALSTDLAALALLADGDPLPALGLPPGERRQVAGSLAAQAGRSSAPSLIDVASVEAPRRDEFDFDLLAQPVVGGGLALSASVLLWVTRAGGLAAAMMASVPAWRSFDPTPILERRRDSDRRSGPGSGPGSQRWGDQAAAPAAPADPVPADNGAAAVLSAQTEDRPQDRQPPMAQTQRPMMEEMAGPE